MVFWNVIFLLVIVIGLVFLQAPILLWTVIIGLALILTTIFGSLSYPILIFSWLFFLLATSFVCFKTLRQRYFTQRVINFLATRMPTISKTEQEAIEAGDVFWEKELFCGRPNWKKLLSLPQPTLSGNEQQFLDQQVTTLCALLNDWDIVAERHDMPEEVWNYLKQERFFGIGIPTEYDGLGFSAVAHSSIIVKIASRSVSAAVNTMVPNSLGPAELILHYGTQQQKDYYLPRLARGEDIPCFALTAPDAGSDAASITDSGVICYGEYEGKPTLGIRLNWNKRYITLAPIATVLGLAFKLYDPDQLLGSEKELGITLCLVPTTLPGVEIGHRHVPMHIAFLNGPTRGTDVFVPIDFIIGGAEMAGQGWRMLMECLAMGRGISIPALSTACAKLAYRSTGAYAQLRKQFNTSIANFEGVEEALGNIAGYTYLLEGCRLLTAGAVDSHIKPAIASAIAKYHMTEIARVVLNHAMDIHAGQAIQVGPSNFLAHGYLGMPVSITVEGANILTRNLIIFGQGAIRCHPYILAEVEALAVPDGATRLNEFDKLLVSHLGYFISQLIRNLCIGLTAGKLLFAPRSKVRGCYRQVKRMSAALALLADMTLMILGGTLKRRERISARLGDLLSQLYLASAALKYFHDQGEPACEVVYVKWSVENCLATIQITIDELLNNFPKPFLGNCLRRLIFPWGTAYRKPKDQLHHELVQTMLKPSALRDRLTKHCYLGKNITDPVHRLDLALAQMSTVEPIWKKFQTAVRNGKLPQSMSLPEKLQAIQATGELSEEEARTLQEFDALYQEVIKVDEFTFDLKTVVSN